jgi:hypothetical protein
MQRVEQEAELIRKKHYSNDIFSSDPSREREMKNLIAGYSVDPISLEQWKRIHDDF